MFLLNFVQIFFFFVQINLCSISVPIRRMKTLQENLMFTAFQKHHEEFHRWKRRSGIDEIAPFRSTSVRTKLQVPGNERQWNGEKVKRSERGDDIRFKGEAQTRWLGELRGAPKSGDKNFILFVRVQILRASTFNLNASLNTRGWWNLSKSLPSMKYFD